MRNHDKLEQAGWGREEDFTGSSGAREDVDPVFGAIRPSAGGGGTRSWWAIVAPCWRSGRALLYPALPWGAPPSWKQKSGSGQTFLTVWEIWTFLCTLYVAGMVPWAIGFSKYEAYSAKNDGSSCIWEGSDKMQYRSFSSLSFAEIVFLFDIAVDMTFLLDIIITFHTAIWVVSREGTPHWVLIDDLRTIGRQYVRGFFFLDLVGVFPWHFLDCVHWTQNAPFYVKFLRLFRLLKLLRLYRIRRVLENLHQRFPQSRYLVTSVELFMMMILISHWIACAWFRLGSSDPEGWVTVEGLTGPEAENFEGEYPDAFHFRQWITAIYWALTTLTTIGYGDITATTSEERLLAVFVMATGSAFFAWCTGRMTALLTHQSGCVEKFEIVLDELNQFMEARNFPKELTKRLRSYYMLKFPTKMIFDEESILASLEESLRKDCYLHLYRDIVSNVVLFALCDERTQSEICYRLHSCYRAAGSNLFTAGSHAEALYLVRFGVVELFHNDTYLKSCYSGDLVGENAVLGITADGKRTMQAKTKTMCELCTLYIQDFTHLLEEYPQFLDTVSRTCELHVERLQEAADSCSHLPLRDWLCIDWKMVGDRYRKEQKREEQRKMGKLGGASTMDLSKFIGAGEVRKPLRTYMVLSLQVLELLSLRVQGKDSDEKNLIDAKGPRRPGVEDVKTPERSSVQRHIDAIYVKVEWQGDPVMHICVQGESAMTHLDDEISSVIKQGSVELNTPVDILLTHDSNDWSSMPDLQISVYRVKVHRTVSELSARGKKRVTNDPERAEMIWRGSVPVKDLVDNRITISGGKVLRYRLHSTSDATSELGDASLTLSCRLTRNLWPTSLWLRALSLIRNKDQSHYFNHQRGRFVEAVRKNSEHRFQAVRKRVMRNSLLAKWQVLSDDVGGNEGWSGPKHEASLENAKLMKRLELQFTQDKEERLRDRIVTMDKLERILEVVEGVRSETAQLRRETAQLETRQRNFERQMQEHAALLRPVKSEFNAAVSGVARGKAERESIDDHDVQLSIRPHDMTLANGDGKERGNAVDAYGQLVGVEAYRMSRGQGSIEAKGNNETARRRTSTSPPKAPLAMTLRARSTAEVERDGGSAEQRGSGGQGDFASTPVTQFSQRECSPPRQIGLSSSKKKRSSTGGVEPYGPRRAPQMDDPSAGARGGGTLLGVIQSFVSPRS